MFQTSPTMEIVAQALDTCALRQAAYSANLANHNVEGYRRLEVQFDAQAMRTEVTNAGMAARDGGTQASIVSTNAAVKVDEEIANMVRNEMRFVTLLDAYARSSSLLKMAVHEGRG